MPVVSDTQEESRIVGTPDTTIDAPAFPSPTFPITSGATESKQSPPPPCS